MTPKTRTRAEYDAALIAAADYFTAVRKVGPGQYERHERATQPEIEELAQALANKARRSYMIYAVAGDRDCHVKNIDPA